jgi:hypothetical protein
MYSSKWLVGVSLVLMGTSLAQGADITTLFNTGVDNAGMVLPNGVNDPHYAFIAPSPIVGAPLVRTSAAGFPIMPSGPWLGDNTLSRWITPNPASGPVGTYFVRTTFDLTGFDPSSAMITGMWTTDNNGVNILINGTATGFTTPFKGFGMFFPFAINSGFVPGLNTLDFVYFEGGVIGGLRVQMTGTANPTGAEIPEPGSLTLFGLGILGLAGYGWRRYRLAA